ncbi:MAG: DMT family transporter [Gammaproteobacteria bacterium]|nr:DMT family transporter [Gammaproteobacteria bacterium]
MNQAVAFALLSMTFGGLIDTLYKVYARQTRSRGVYLFGMGLVWLLLQLADLAIRGESLRFSSPDLRYGIAAGVLVTLSNLLYIESMTHLDISLGATIYRLNTVGVVVLGFLFLAEPLGGLKLLGIACGVVAVVFLYRPEDGDRGRIVASFIWVMILASILRAGFGVISKDGILAGASPAMIMVIAAACWVAGGLGYALWRERSMSVGAKEIGYCVGSGLVVFAIVNFLMLALRFGEATIVIPIANLSFMVALAISVALKYERLSLRKCAALGFAAAAILLLSRAA